jgi:O-antigen ligase
VHAVLLVRNPADRMRLFALGAVAMVVIAFLPVDRVAARIDTIAPYVAGTIDTGASGETHTTRGFLFWSSLAMFQERPFLGVGYENFGFHLGYYQWDIPGAWRVFGEAHASPHGSHHGLLANLGLAGGIVWVFLWVGAVSTLRRAWRVLHPEDADARLMVQALSVTLGIFFLYGFSGDIHQSKIFWLVLGLIAAAGAAAHLSRTRRLNPESTRTAPAGAWRH